MSDIIFARVLSRKEAEAVRGGLVAQLDVPGADHAAVTLYPHIYGDGELCHATGPDLGICILV